MLKLYTAHNSICTQKVFLTLIEKGLDWESEYIDLFKNEQYRPEYLRLNPKGVVPTLIHEGHPVIESTLICEYIDRTFPDAVFGPAGRLRPIADAAVEQAYRRRRVRSDARNQLLGDVPRQDARDDRGSRETGASGISAIPAAARASSRPMKKAKAPFMSQQGIFAFEKMFREMEDDLSAQKPWLVGDFSLADISLTPFVARLEYLGLLDIWIAERPLVQAWWTRAKSRPSFKAAIADKLTPEQISSMHVSGARIKDKIASRWREIVKDALH